MYLAYRLPSRNDEFCIPLRLGHSGRNRFVECLAGNGIAQIVLGISIGTIHSASLYFGMAVSDGSTEHSGYHEALIGLDQILGPLVGATMQWIRPDALWPAVMGISGLVSITEIVRAIVGIRITVGIGFPATSNDMGA
jgi:hypothetical protein